MKDNSEDRAPSGGPVQSPTARTSNDASEPNVRDRVGSDAHDHEDGATLRPVSADMQQFIGRQLRAVFDDVAKQPVPDRFLELMKQLDNKTEAR